jgi:SnoaL-like protein
MAFMRLFRQPGDGASANPMGDSIMGTDNGIPKRSARRALFGLPLGLAAIAVLARPARAAAGKHGASSIEGAIARLDAQAELTDARRQITEVVHNYARANDRVDEALFRSCFWPESTHQHGAFKGKSSDFVTRAIGIVSKLRTCSHLITNVSIEVAADKAVCECCFLAHHRRTKKSGEGEEDFFIKGRYLDRFEKRDGVWKIIHRRGLSDFVRVFDPADTSLDAAPPEQLSIHSTEDPIYGMLADLHAGR